MSWTWQGRQLTKAVKDKTVTFTYDSEGIRTSKTVGSTTTKYLLNGTQILAQTTNGKTLSFFYDQQGNRVGMADSSNHFYYYIYNVQGDVIALADASTGKLAATYTYDAWGKIVKINDQKPEEVAADNIANINPFRYRGYYYDTETKLYYLQSRYYDPDTGRFLNADGLIDNRGVITQNLFQYCGNNPIMHADPSGHIFGLVLAIIAVAATVVLASCSSNTSKPASTTKPAPPPKPTPPAPTPTPHVPTSAEKSYAATVYAEAGGENKRSKQAVAHVMNNRIGTNSSWNDIESVISAPYQFDGYNSYMYKEAMNYYNGGSCNNPISRAAMDECMDVVIPIYNGTEADITGGALYFHSLPNPSDWAYHDSFTQIYVPGTEHFWFYK